jgi:hypothetical protein
MENPYPVNCDDCGDTVMFKVHEKHGQGPAFKIDMSEPHYSHSLGQVVQSDSHAKRIAKSKGMIEIGNENPHKHIEAWKPEEYTDDFRDVL